MTTSYQPAGDADLTNQKSNLSSSSSSSSSDSDSGSSDSSSSSSKTKPNKGGKKSAAQFSVTSSGNAGLRLIIATIPRNDRTKAAAGNKGLKPLPPPKPTRKKHSSAKKAKSASSSNKSDCSCCSDDEDDDSDSDSSGGAVVPADGKKEGEVAEKAKANRGGSTSSGARTDSCESDSSEDLLELNPDDLDAILQPDNQANADSLPPVPPSLHHQEQSSSSLPLICKSNPSLSRALHLETENDNASSSDMELPAAINAAILRIESGSEAESTKAASNTTYTSSLLRDYTVRAQNLDENSQLSSRSSPQLVRSLKISREKLLKADKGPARRTEVKPPTPPPAPVVKKPRGRPKSQPAVTAPPATTTPLSESPDSGILSTAQSPAQSPKVGGKKAASALRKEEPARKPTPTASTSAKIGSLTKYNIASLEKSLYANERVLYPPRGKKKGPGRPPKQQPPPPQFVETLDPLWQKIDLNRKFREPCLDGYKSDGAGTGIGGSAGHQSLCCSKTLAAKSGYVSDYGGVSGLGRSKSSSGYKTDQSTKSRRKSSVGGYRSDYSVKAKSCGYRSDCSTRHRKKVRRKRRKKVPGSTPSKPTTPASVNELDILQLAGLTLGSTSESEDSISSRDSIAEAPPKVPRKYAKTPPPLNFNGSLQSSGSKIKGRSRTPAPVATSSPTVSGRLKEKVTAAAKKQMKPMPQDLVPMNNNNNNNNNNNSKKRTFGKGFLLNNLCERVTKRISGQDGSGSGTEKSVASFQALSNKANQSKNRRRSEALFSGACDSSSSKTSGTSFLDRIKECTQLKLDADKPGNLRHRRISTMSRCSSKSTRSRHHIRKRRRRRLKSSSSLAQCVQAEEKIAAEIEELSESLKGLSMVYNERAADAKQHTPSTKSLSTAQATSKRVTKKRKTSDNNATASATVTNHHADSPSTSATAMSQKRRTKKSAPPQGPDEHKLPLKKRHYLLTPGEKPDSHHKSEHHHSPKVHQQVAEEKTGRKAPHYELSQIEQFRVHVAEAIEATISRFAGNSTPIPASSQPVHTPSKDSTKAITPKKRHLLKTPASTEPAAASPAHKSGGHVSTVVDLSIPDSIQAKTQTQKRNSDIITRKKNRLEGLLSKIAPTTGATPSPSASRSPSTSLSNENSNASSKKSSAPALTSQSQRASVIKTSKAAQIAHEATESNSNPPPGVFEPSIDLELQIPTSTISIASVITKTELEMKDGVVAPVVVTTSGTRTDKSGEVAHKRSDKVVEKLLNRTGAHLLLKRKRRKVNRTGFPSAKKKKKKPSDKENDGGDDGEDDEEKPSPLILLDPPPIEDLLKESTAGGSEETPGKNCDRVPKDGETTATFIERNSRPRLSVVSLERLQGKITAPAAAPTTSQSEVALEKRQLREKATKENMSEVPTSVKKPEATEEPPIVKTTGKKGRPEISKSKMTSLDRVKERISKAPRDLSSDNEPLINLVAKVPLSKFMALRETRKSRSLRNEPTIPEPEDKEDDEGRGIRKRTRNQPLEEETVAEPLARRGKSAGKAEETTTRKRGKADDPVVEPVSVGPRKRSKTICQPEVSDSPETPYIRKELKVEISRLNIKIPQNLLNKARNATQPPATEADGGRIVVKIPIAKLRPFQKSLLAKLKFDIFSVLDKDLVQLPVKRTARAVKSIEEPVSKEPVNKEPVSKDPEPEPEKRKVGRPCKKPKEVPKELPKEPVRSRPADTETALEEIPEPGDEECDDHEPLPEEEVGRAATTPLPLQPHLLDESSLSSSDKESRTAPAATSLRKERKKYLPAGLLSDYYKVGDAAKATTKSTKQTVVAEKVSLPPPAYCERYFRRTERDFELPYDLWYANDIGKLPGRDIVASWNYKKIRTNVYGDVRSQPAFDHQPCSCKLETSCREDCLNRMVYTECMPETCPCGDKCQNQKIQRHDYPPGIERFMTDKKGFGVRTKNDIKKGTFISEYLGEVVTEREFKDRMQTLYANDTHHYCLNLDGGLVIDGHRMGSECRFVNHSCSPNCEIQKWSVNGLFRMALFALRDIRAHEELTYDYNFSLFNPAEGQPCRCDTTHCRGVIGGKSQRVNPKPVAEVKTTETGKSSKNRSGRPRKRQARKNQSQITYKYGATLPPFHPPTPKERAIIVEKHCFLLRNLNKMKRLKGRISPTLSQTGHTSSGSPAPSSSRQSLTAQIAALRGPRNMQTRGLASVAQDPEVEKTAKLAVVLREICAEIGAKKNETGTTLIVQLQIPPKKKCPQYHEKISQPIDLSHIEANIEKGVYKLPKAFDEDIQKMFKNAMKFYGTGTPVSAAVTALQSFYATIKQNVAAKLVEILGGVEHIKGFAPLPKPNPQDPTNFAASTGDDEEDEIRCICGMPRDEGVMIQCSQCLVWQHLECTKADPEADDFKCERCEPRDVDYEITLDEYTDEGYQYYLTLMRGNDLQIRQGDAVYVLRDIPMSPTSTGNQPRKHTYETIGNVDFSECDIFRVERLWKDKTGKRFVFGHHYLRPHETFHEPTRKFYPNEVLRVPLYEVVQIELIIDRCWVLDPQTFCKGRPLAASEPHVYICELRVDKSASAFSKISQKHAYQVCTQSYAFHKFEQKLKIYRTYAPHDLGSIPVPKEKKKRKPEENTTPSSKKMSAPIVQLLPPPPKTLNEKRNRLETTLTRLMTQLRLRLNDQSQPMDLSYLLTGRGARSRRTNNPTPVPV